MKIMVCVKIEPDLSMLADSDWQADDLGKIDCRYARRQLNVFDQSAAELALTLVESTGVHALTAVTVGDDDVEPVLKTLLALNFSRAVRIAPPIQADLRFNAQCVAQLLAAFHQSQPIQTVVILGSQSGEGQNRQTGPLLAEMFGWPCVTQVTEIRLMGENLLQVTRQMADDIQYLTLRPPVVLVTGQGEQARLLRIPTLKQKLAAARKPLDVLMANTLLSATELPVSTSILHLHRTSVHREGRIITGQNPQEKARILYEQFLRQRLQP